MDISSILTGGIDKVVDSVGNAIDKLVTSDEERMQLKNALIEAKLKAQLESENNYLKHEQEITQRWVSDNEHTITRLVRPLIVVWAYIMFTAVMISDGNIGQFSIKDAYLPMLETIVVTVTVAYFGSRGVEKTALNIRGRVADKIIAEVNNVQSK